MKWVSAKNDREIIEILLRHILNKYNYEPFCEEYIEDNFFEQIGERVVADILIQLYSEIGLYKEEDNIYIQHLNNIKKNFKVDCNILDVASGCVPAFANIIAREQLKIGKGTVTIYDPNLVIDKVKYPNMKLNRTEFNLDIDVSEFDLITGIFTCDATDIILESACKNKKDFYVAMCGCSHLSDNSYPGYSFPLAPSIYQSMIIKEVKSMLKKYDNGLLYIDYLDDKFDIPYPILYNKKR